ncbi:prepilin peptidase [Thalassococcus profundi]|nr:A24 family peptidase [Thalassococcus profundi]
MTDTALFSLLLILVAPVAGSFLGVVIDRLPRGISVVAPRSACRSCGTILGARDLVPVLSYLRRRGRCRTCGAAIPPALLYTEIAATASAVLAVIVGDTPLQMALIALVLWLLWTLALIDLFHFRLPDPLTAPLFLAALAYAWLYGDPALALSGAAIGAGSFLLLRLVYSALRHREGLGLGDVKLMAGLGALVPPTDLPLLVLVAALSALVAAALTRGGWTADRPIPFGVALCAAGALVWLARVVLP